MTVAGNGYVYTFDNGTELESTSLQFTDQNVCNKITFDRYYYISSCLFINSCLFIFILI
jgi:hypothetical protein